MPNRVYYKNIRSRSLGSVDKSCHFEFINPDDQSPTLQCPVSVTSLTPTVTFEVTVTDNADPSPVVTYSPLGPGDEFPVGETTEVLVTATDASGNIATCSISVTVEGIDNK